jgi:glycosyltransferase involved in cell wall biosynthesis
VSEPNFIYSTEVDLSLETGYGINEREFVRALLDAYPGQVSVVVPAPARPGGFRDDRITYVTSHHRHRALPYARHIIDSYRVIRRIIDAKRPAAVVFRLGAVPLAPAALALTSRTPMILKTMGGFSLFDKSNRPGIVRAVSPAVQWLYRFVMRRAAGGDTVSPAYVKWLASRLGCDPSRISVILNGANISEFAPMDRAACRAEFGIGPAARVVGYVGALADLRNVDMLVRAMPGLASVDCSLLIAGDGPYRASLEALVRELGVGDRVRFTGKIPYQSVPRLINALDAAVDLTLVPMTVDGEVHSGSYSQKIPQYLACGVPVVGWDVPGTEFIRDHDIGRLAAAEDPAALAVAIRQVLDLPASEHAAMRRRARDFAVAALSSEALAVQRFDLWRRLALQAGAR